MAGIDDLLKLIRDNAASGGSAPSSSSGSAASISPNKLSSLIPGLSPSGGGFGGGSGGFGAIGGGEQLISSLVGDFTSPSSAGSTAGGLEGALQGGLSGAELGSLAGPWGAGIGAILGALLEGLGGAGIFGAGVPREAKTASIASALEGSANPLDALLGKYAQSGVNRGDVLSESGSSTFGKALERVAAMLEGLTGQQASGVTGTGNFQKDPTLNFTKLGNAASEFKIPAGYEFLSDPSKLPTAMKDIQRAVGFSAGDGKKGAENEWQKVVNELIASGALQKYQGALGPVGGGETGTKGIPNLSAPHPLQQRVETPAPYPV